MAAGIYSAVSGAVASMRQLEAVSSNLANVDTPGYKAQRLAFSEVLARVGGTGAPPSSFVQPGAPINDMRQGHLRTSSSSLDVALEGPGFLVLQGPNERLLGRGGHLSVNREGELTDANGYRFLDPRGRPVRVGPDVGQVRLEPDGTVRAAKGKVGRLQLVEVDDARKLRRIGGPLYQMPPGVSVAPAAETQVRQGQTELPNINPVLEVTAMVTASRRYEALHRMISTFREIESRTATQIAGK
jgi:flagellar basal-body rod protein FlgF